MEKIAIVRATDAVRVNAVLNDYRVRPWVADEGEGDLDVSAGVADPRNVFLLGEHGGCFFIWLQPGVYEVHTAVLPAGRGAWVRALTETVVWWMFTQTDAYEILTRVPAGHIAAKTAAEAQGLKYEFTRPGECLFLKKRRDLHVHGCRIQDWMARAPYWAAERGARFHDQLHAEAARLGITAPAHEDDPNHNAYVGACYDMVVGGQVKKGVALYNRWALVSRHAPIQLVTESPPRVKMDIGTLSFYPDSIEVTL